ncbi:Protein of unknown function [Singulisphaera sp. GP187]|uniref:DUF1549 domain-containing protein n=1 Tax=Singulisphaera sp. GP187 TaxID=1882752 RepID=UPI0009280DD7|nr:DUF1549 domain-containing protein [Singulisphaera sp. GP187]SIO24914.1 Protein of unknown function [Singulisphaera sp. GP187]
MRRILRLPLSTLAITVLIAAGSSARAVDLQPADRPIPEVVDFYLDAKLSQEGIKPAAATDDAGLVRRLTLDLIGRIPTAAEMRAYVESTQPEKQVELVDRLMASPAYARHMANELDAMMMAGTRGSLRDYLSRAIEEDRPWDQIFRELILADESQPGLKGVGNYLKPRAKDLDRLTSDVSSIFFGVDVSCAKCHDHPRVVDWKQDHYYGMKSFFARTYEAGTFLGENDYGNVKFQTTGGEERQARLMFLTGRIVDVPAAKEPSKEEQKEEKRRIAEAKKKKEPPPAPKFSARAQLVDVALQPGERDFFANAIVNRLWHRFFGSGLVIPLDQMHSANPPSHPELLAWLARDLVEHRYDLRRLIRGLVLSQAYARTSIWQEGEPPDPRLFAVAAVRPLTPVQLTTSMWVATTDPSTLPAGVVPPGKLEADLDGRARELANALAKPGEDYQIGVSEALLLSNGDRVQALLTDQKERLVGRLAQIDDGDERVAVAVRNILSRPPADEEVSLLGEYLAQRSDRQVEAIRQLVWVLLTSAEFRFNH